MRFLWKTQLRTEKGKLLPKTPAGKNKRSRREKLETYTGKGGSYFGVMFLWAVFIGTLVYVFFFSPYLFITDIHLYGAPETVETSLNATVHESISGTYLGFIPKNSFFVVFPSRLEKKIKSEFPLVKEAKVSRTFPHALTVYAIPREKLVLWCSGEACYHLLETGQGVEKTEVFNQEENVNKTLTVMDLSNERITMNEKIFNDTFVPFVIMLENSFQTRLGIPIENTFSTSSRFSNEVRLKTSEGWEVFIDTEQPLAESLDTLSLILEKEIGGDKRKDLRYIDLRTEGRAYYSFQEGSASSVSNENTGESEGEKDKKKDTSEKK